MLGGLHSGTDWSRKMGLGWQECSLRCGYPAASLFLSFLHISRQDSLKDRRYGCISFNRGTRVNSWEKGGDSKDLLDVCCLEVHIIVWFFFLHFFHLSFKNGLYINETFSRPASHFYWNNSQRSAAKISTNTAGQWRKLWLSSVILKSE